MQIDPGGLSTATKLTATQEDRNTVYCFLVNWDRSATDLTVCDGAWTDETANVDGDVGGDMRLQPFEENIAGMGLTEPATMSLSLRNSSGRFSVNRTDGALYANIRMDGGGNNRGIYQAPVMFWAGLYYTNAFAYGPINAIVSTTTTTVTFGSGGPLTGHIMQVDSEKMLVLNGGVTATVIRGFDGSTAATHLAAATVTQLGGVCRMFTGSIHGSRESSLGFSIILDCIDRAYWLMQQHGSTAVSQDTRFDLFLPTILNLLPGSPSYIAVPAGQRSIDQGIYPISFAYLEDEPLWQHACQMAAAEGAYCFFSSSGVLRFWNMQHLLLSEPDTKAISTSHTASQYTFDRANLRDFSPEIDYSNIFKSVTVEYNPMTIAPRQAVYNSNEVIYIQPSGTYTDSIRFNFPALSIVTPVGGAAPAAGVNDARDFVAHNGGGTDITTNVTLSTFTAYGGTADIVFSNANTQYGAFVTRFQIRANPLLRSPSKKVKTTITPVPAGVSTRDKPSVNNLYITNYVQATALSQFLADRYKTARTVYHLLGAPGVFQLELGDLITVSESTALSSSVTMYAINIRWRVAGVASAQPKFEMDMDAIDSASLFQQANGANYFKVGTDSLSNAKVFWY